MKRSNCKSKRTGLGSIVVVVLLICSIVSINRLNLNSEAKECEKKLNEVKKEYASEQDRTDEIKDYGAYVKTKKYVEEVAREKLGLVYKDEILFKAEE